MRCAESSLSISLEDLYRLNFAQYHALAGRRATPSRLTPACGHSSPRQRRVEKGLEREVVLVRPLSS